MRATVLYVAHACLIEPTDALVVVSHAAICGSDLWPYNLMETSETGHQMGHEAIGVVVLMPDVLTGWIEPGRVFDLTLSLDQVAESYRAMDERRAIKALIRGAA